jgi:membrane protease YdiL (CAAX protease family)
VSTRWPPPKPAAGWFPDPWEAGNLRYWDGESWTGWVTIGPPEPESPPTLPLWTGLVGLVVLLGGFVAGVVVALPFYLLGAGDAVLVLVGGLGVYAPVAWWCWRVSKRYGRGDLGHDLGLRFRAIDLLTGAGTWLAATVLQVAVLLIVQLLGLPLGSNTESIADSRDDAAAFAAVTVLAVVIAPVVEELFFRGLLLRALRSRFTMWAAIAIQAAIFGLIHLQVDLGLDNVSLIAALTAVGAAFGFAADQAGRLGPAIVGHAIFNGLAIAVVLATG